MCTVPAFFFLALSFLPPRASFLRRRRGSKRPCLLSRSSRYTSESGFALFASWQPHMPAWQRAPLWPVRGAALWAETGRWTVTPSRRHNTQYPNTPRRTAPAYLSRRTSKEESTSQSGRLILHLWRSPSRRLQGQGQGPDPAAAGAAATPRACKGWPRPRQAPHRRKERAKRGTFVISASAGPAAQRRMARSPCPAAAQGRCTSSACPAGVSSRADACE